jgi:hypothetical protein
LAVAARGPLLAICIAAALLLFPGLVLGQTTAVWGQVFDSYVRARQPDSALRTLHAAMEQGDSAARVARFALHEGNAWYRRGAATKNIDTLTVAIRFLAYADSLVPSDPAKYLIVASRVMIGFTAEEHAAKTRSCRFAKMAQSNWTQALAGVRDLPVEDPDLSLVGVVVKTMPTVEQQVRTFCL